MVPAELAKAVGVLCPGTNCLTWTVPGQLCDACWGFRIAVLARINAYWHLAHEQLEPSRIGDDKVSGGSGFGSRPPLDSHVFAAIEAALAVVVGWASRIRERRGAPALPGLATARTSWLFDHALPELTEGDGTLSTKERAEYVGDLYRIYQLLRAVVRETPRESEHVDIACPECERMTVVTVKHGESVVCLTCNAAWSEAGWYALLSANRVL